MRLTDDLKKWAERKPTHPLLIWNGETISYKQAEEMVSTIAQERFAPHTGDVVGIRLADPVKQILYFLAAQRAGAVPVLFHEYLSGVEVEELLEKRPIDVLLSDAPLEGLSWERVGNLWKIMCKKQGRRAGFGVLTSGSSGLAKVFFRKDASWRDFFPVQNQIFRIQGDSTLYLSGSMAFTGNLNMLMAFLYEGATIAGTEKVAPKTWMQEIKASRTTHVYMIPSKLSALCRVKDSAESVTHVLTGSQLMTDRLLTSLETHFPGARTILYYGASELSYVTYIEGKEIRDFPDAVGKPFPRISISIRNQEIFVDTPYGIEGAARPMTCHDMGRIDEDGRLHFLGRAEDQYHVKGNHVSRQKVLSHLLMLPGVEEAEVMSQKQDNGDDTLVAFLVGEKSDELALLHLLQSKLKPWEIPARFLWLPSIPKTSTGKVDRKKLWMRKG